MPNRNEPLIDAPIPGMSMTHELGARPWQQPAKYTTVEDASKYYITRMQDKQFTIYILDFDYCLYHQFIAIDAF